MKKLFYLLLALYIILTSCKKDENNTPINSNSSFTCKVDGVQLHDAAPLGNIITTNPALNGALKISGTSNLKDVTLMNTIYITVYNFSTVTTNTSLTLGSPGAGSAVVWKGNDEFLTDISPYTGIITFSKITANRISGTFNFNTHLGTAGICTVTEGIFSNIAY
tara:strand:+ start:362 stop:853 length:492 start_codon:yes stop_codon:yes gene_type:complete